MTKAIRICPKCKSVNVKKEITPLSAAGVPEEWVCNNCNFRSYLFPEIELKNKTTTKK